ncbi:type II CRISPR RNA-guided endonuclease Cas9 [Sulfurimonas sp.]|jgi:CRISPR-associated endonuclease Csn1|uniref:type II CRISPR RNA-guided endonuclease Cas9 n=1 Tax=Sulfurimonas sp. TaxID=2022749 RepID=UPI0025D37EF5|nr:type II CRISPR RNA-guided endonuclease Cas9 [Sulfurimonas sp.]MCK9472755.1 type II CRISPR RNA-guided endonuclease Cas9 [Sulfurimonas sp.]MDD3505476.1 type II CRISPR RNA-guided endonuclease Cas9 [Sulfurimonas sp.]
MSKIILGLDLGITSIGWALANIDDNEPKNNKIIDSGVRIFTIAEHPKDGKSLALPRREARSARRTTKRKAQKLRAIKRLLINEKIITADELENLFIGNKNQKDAWQLRRDAIYRLLDNKELARIMIHLAKHRGYASNRKSEEPTDSEGKAVLGGIEKNKKLIQEKAYLTIGEYISTKKKKRNGKNSEGKLNYENSVSREMLIDEINILFHKQKEFGNKFVSNELLNSYQEIAFTQRPLKSVEGMVANCPFEPLEKRAPKASCTFEKFRALQKLKNLRITTQHGEITLNKEQINQAIQNAKTTSKFTYKSLKKLFDLDKDAQFKGLTYFDHKTGEVKDSESTKLVDFSAYQKIQKAIEGIDNMFWDNIKNNDESLDKIAKILSTEKNDKKSLEELNKLIDNVAVCNALITLSFSGFGHISTKALAKIIPFLEDGFDYDKACEMAGYDFKAIFKGNKSKLLPPLSAQENLEMTNPVVKRAIAQMRLVYNAISRKYGALDAVHIEFTRDIKKSHKDRNDIKKAQDEFQILKEEAKTHATEVLGKEPNAKELLKFRLWKEQNKECIYSGEYINPNILADPYATEIDHILPYSRSLDDSLNNKVLCLTKQNQDKGNKTPFEYFKADENSVVWQGFSGRIEGLKNIRHAKKGRLLKTNFDENSENAFKERNKNDTSYISKFVKNYIEAHIEFKESKAKQHVFTRNGMLTSQLRYKWGVGDKNRDNHFHHAEDAIILAFSTQSQVQKLSTISGKREGFSFKNREEKAKNLKFEPPMDEFGNKVKESVENIFVSHMPRRKISGAAHKETVYSDKTLSVKKPDGKIDSLKGNSIKNNIKLKHGIALNDTMPRVDLFENKKTKKYYLVPIYVSDFIKDTLPNKAIVQGNKPWLEMDDEYEFLFSFYKSDLIEIKTKKTATKESVQILGYYDGTHSGTANITLKAHNGSEEYSYGSQNLVFVKKYQVDALGNYVEVKSQKREGTKKQKR